MILRPALARRILQGQRAEQIVPRIPREHEGRSYVVRTRHGGPPLGRANVTEIREAKLNELDNDQAVRAGFNDRDELYAYWRERHSTGPLAEPVVWIVALELDREHQPRLLHRDSSHGYTSDPRLAMRGEPEAIDDVSQRWITTGAERRFEEHQAREEMETLDQRVRRLMEAQAQGLDVSRQLAAIDRRVKAAERKLGRKAA